MLMVRAAGRECAVLGLAERRRGKRVDQDLRFRSDLWTLRLRLQDRARRRYRELGRTLRGIVDAFAAGVEQERRRLLGAARRGDRGDRGLPRALLEFRVRPWHVIALDLRVSVLSELSAFAGAADSGRMSNVVAIAARRSTTGAAWLLSDPHLPLLDVPELRIWAAHIRTRTRSVSGLGRLGSPFVALGTNGSVAWGAASNWPVPWRVERVPRQEARLRKQRVRIPVRGRGHVEASIECDRSWDRPVLARRGRDLLVAADMLALRGSDLSTQFFHMARARTAAGVIRAASRHLALAGQTFVAADSSGAIAGSWLVPRSAGGRRARSEARRIDDGGEDGLLVNCNATPSLMRPGAVGGWRPAPDFADPAALSSYRHRRARRLLDARRRVGRTHLAALAGDATNILAAELRPRIPVLARRLGRWSGRDGVSSRLATLFHLFVDAWLGLEPRARVWCERPEWLPDEFDSVALSRAARALAEAERRFVRANRPRWGDVHRLHLGDLEVPLSGSAHALAASAPWPARRPGSSFDRIQPTPRAAVAHGAACTLLVRLHGPEVTLWVKKPVPNSGRPDDPAALPLLRSFAADELLPFVPVGPE